MNLGENIKKCRKLKGFTQNDLSKKLGITTRTIQNYESNNREPSLDMLFEISKVLDVNIMALIDFDKFNKLYKKLEDNSIIFRSLDFYKDAIEQYWQDVVVWYPLDKVDNFNLDELTDNEITELASSLSLAFQLKLKEITKKNNKNK